MEISMQALAQRIVALEAKTAALTRVLTLVLSDASSKATIREILLREIEAEPEGPARDALIAYAAAAED